jgi:hypothetical protein
VRRVHLLTLFFVSGFIFFNSASGAVEYTAGDLRDPFSNLAPPPMEEQPKVEVEQSASIISTFVLQGVVIGGKEPSAIVNEKIVKIGSKLNVGVVSNITKDGVYVRYGGKEYLLKRVDKRGQGK